MVDISSKKNTNRHAVASARVKMSPKAFAAFLRAKSPKGDVLEAARVAGVLAAKATPSIIPFCHPLELRKVEVSFDIDTENFSVAVIVEALYQGQTGVEMEALTAAAVAALTIYDMMKWADKGIVISDVMLLEKSGGKSGNFKRKKSI